MPGATETHQLIESGAGSPAPALDERFAAAMARLGPFEPRPALAIAVSGGADSMALAVLARDWTRGAPDAGSEDAGDAGAGDAGRGGSVLALVVDHGLRADSADEARLTMARLAALAIPARLLTLTNLARGPALAERARLRRYEVLIEACAGSGRLHLLLGHHAADQAETVAMRVLRDSGTHGLAGMAALRETKQVRLLRPLLGISPAALRECLLARGIDWVEDPSNRDPRALRSRLRAGFTGRAVGVGGVACAAAMAGRLRAAEEAAVGRELAARVSVRAEGFALMTPGPIGVSTLRRLLHSIGGEAYAPGAGRIADLAATPRAATLAGVRLVPAGRLGAGLLVVREEAAIGGAVPARDGAVWDGRFRLVIPRQAAGPGAKIVPGGVPEGSVPEGGVPEGSVPEGGVPEGETCRSVQASRLDDLFGRLTQVSGDSAFSQHARVDRLGDDSSRFRRSSALPAAVLRTLPAVWVGGTLAAVPHLGYAVAPSLAAWRFVFEPRTRLGGAPFFGADLSDVRARGSLGA